MLDDVSWACLREADERRGMKKQILQFSIFLQTNQFSLRYSAERDRGRGYIMAGTGVHHGRHLYALSINCDNNNSRFALALFSRISLFYFIFLDTRSAPRALNNYLNHLFVSLPPCYPLLIKYIEENFRRNNGYSGGVVVLLLEK